MVDKKELLKFSIKDELLNYYMKNQDEMEFKTYLKILSQIGQNDSDAKEDNKTD